jgi:hypothetical protein
MGIHPFPELRELRTHLLVHGWCAPLFPFGADAFRRF